MYIRLLWPLSPHLVMIVWLCQPSSCCSIVRLHVHDHRTAVRNHTADNNALSAHRLFSDHDFDKQLAARYVAFLRAWPRVAVFPPAWSCLSSGVVQDLIVPSQAHHAETYQERRLHETRHLGRPRYQLARAGCTPPPASPTATSETPGI